MKSKFLQALIVLLVLACASGIIRNLFWDKPKKTTASPLLPKSSDTGTITTTGKPSANLPPSSEAEAPDRPLQEEAPESMRKILDENAPFNERLSLVNHLSRNLKEDERRALYHFLKRGENNENNHVLKNDIINALRDQESPPTELTGVLLDIFYDKSQDMTMRSYALQHLRPWYQMENMKDPAIVKAFNDGADEHSTEIAGVALLAMSHLAEKNEPGFDSGTVAEKAAAIANDSTAYELSRISAVGVCGRLGDKSVLPTIRETVANSTSVTLKMASIAALGDIGERSDLALLEKLQSERPYSVAAKSAISKLKSKI